MPPGRASRSALRPFHCTIFCGSMKKSNTVSGRAAILISRSTAVATSGCSTATSPPSLLEFGRFLEALEGLAPERVEKRPQVGEALRAEAVQPTRALSPLGHEPGLAQYREVLGDGGPGDLEAGGNLAGRELAPGYEAKDAAPVRLGDRAEGFFHGKVI